MHTLQQLIIRLPLNFDKNQSVLLSLSLKYIFVILGLGFLSGLLLSLGSG